MQVVFVSGSKDEMVLAMDMGKEGGITLPELEQVLQMDEKATRRNKTLEEPS